MPLLILAVIAGLIVFYFKGRTGPLEGSVTLASELPAVPVIEPLPAPPLASPTAEIPAPEAAPPLVNRPDVVEKDFTPWMSSLALDTYLRQKNRGYQGSYWSRGNWIRAIEGRWHEGAREFRIALGTMSRPGEIQWQYRLDLTVLSFADELARLTGEGYALTQSQAYRHPDGSRRYQAVWQREDPARVAGR